MPMSAQEMSQHRLQEAQEAFLSLLRQARLPTDDVRFSSRPAAYHAGNELVGTSTCPSGHAVSFTLRELHEAVDNSFFNDVAVVPCLCPVCAYPGSNEGEEPRQRKTTVFHRLAILRELYDRPRYVSGFDSSGKSFEQYNCGELFADGSTHPNFAIRYDKLALAKKQGRLRHVCYVCGIRAGVTPETKQKTLEMLAGRMQLLEEQMSILGRLAPGRVQPQVLRLMGDEEPISTTTTRLKFQCGNEQHPPTESTADNFFKKARGGYCPACLREAGLRSTEDLEPMHP